jgi:hypothetical protein
MITTIFAIHFAFWFEDPGLVHEHLVRPDLPLWAPDFLIAYSLGATNVAPGLRLVGQVLISLIDNGREVNHPIG